MMRQQKSVETIEADRKRWQRAAFVFASIACLEGVFLALLYWGVIDLARERGRQHRLSIQEMAAEAERFSQENKTKNRKLDKIVEDMDERFEALREMTDKFLSREGMLDGLPPTKDNRKQVVGGQRTGL